MKSILLVDDDPGVRDAMQRMLSREGYVVRLAADGTEGRAAYDADPADLVITDMIMPHEHGLDLIKHLRQRYPEVRILAISGGGNFGPQAYKPEAITTQAYLAGASAAGARAVLSKLFDRAQLLEAVRAVLESDAA